jgi:hypothetical protein
MLHSLAENKGAFDQSCSQLVGRNFKDFDAPSAMECSQLAPKLEV